MTTPFYDDGTVTLYLGDMREVLPALGVTADLVCADPPYSETSLAWDRWPDGWLITAAETTRSLWCFGSMRMFGERWSEFGEAGWKRSQDVVGVDEDGAPVYGDVTTVWEKNTGTSRAADRFRRVHEYALHWYQGAWRDVRHETPRVPATPEQIARNGTAARTSTALAHTGSYGDRAGWTETGTRLMRSVIRTPTMRGKAIHPSEKPVDLLRPLIEYACPPLVSVLKCLECGIEQRKDLSTVRRTDSQSSCERLLQQGVQGEGSGRTFYTLRSVRHAIPASVANGSSTPGSDDVLASVRSGANAPATETVRVVSGSVPAEEQQVAILFEDVRGEVLGDGEAQGTSPDPEGIRSAVPTGAPDGIEAGLPAGASESDGGRAGPSPRLGRGGSPQERDQGRQPSGESRGSTQTRARSHPQAITEADHLSALPGVDRGLGTCPNCHGPLIEAEVPGLVIDPFAGSGSTLEVARLTGRRAIGIEAHEPYLEAAALRLAQAPLEIA